MKILAIDAALARSGLAVVVEGKAVETRIVEGRPGLIETLPPAFGRDGASGRRTH